MIRLPCSSFDRISWRGESPGGGNDRLRNVALE